MVQPLLSAALQSSDVATGQPALAWAWVVRLGQQASPPSLVVTSSHQNEVWRTQNEARRTQNEARRTENEAWRSQNEAWGTQNDAQHTQTDALGTQNEALRTPWGRPGKRDHFKEKNCFWARPPMGMPANGCLEKETILKKKMLLGTPAN